MVRKAWNGVKEALGDNSILSIKRVSSQRITFRSLVSQDTLVNAMTTFAVTGMEAEFEQGMHWMETQLEFDRLDKDLDVSRVVTSYIGGLLSWHDNIMLRAHLEPRLPGQSRYDGHQTGTGVQKRDWLAVSLNQSGHPPSYRYTCLAF